MEIEVRALLAAGILGLSDLRSSGNEEWALELLQV
jgi:hypothetical protein